MSGNPPAAPAASPPSRETRQHVLEEFLSPRVDTSRGIHSLLLMDAKTGAEEPVLEGLCEIVRTHYVAPETTARRLAALGGRQTAALLKERLPTGKRSRSGDMGEILATEVAEGRLGFDVPVRRLRWKDGRDMALRGDDIVGVLRGSDGGVVRLLKGESKSRADLAAAVVTEASEALARDRGRPNCHSVLFVAERLRESGEDGLATSLEEAVLVGFQGYVIEHLLFTATGSDPERLLTEHLGACVRKKRARHVVGVQIEGHGRFISSIFERV